MVGCCEYPEPVIAAYLQAVHSLPMPVKVEDLNARFKERSKNARLSGKIALLLAGWVVSTSIQMSIANATMTVKDQDARTAYRSLLAELKHRGWPAEWRSKVVSGLNALRGRRMNGASGERLYAATMESLVPRGSIGWD